MSIASIDDMADIDISLFVTFFTIKQKKTLNSSTPSAPECPQCLPGSRLLLQVRHSCSGAAQPFPARRGHWRAMTWQS